MLRPIAVIVSVCFVYFRPITAIVFVCFATLGVLLLSSNIMQFPLTMWSSFYDTIISIFIGHLVTQIIVLSLDFPLCCCTFRLETVHYLVALFSYTVILVYKQNVILALIGMVAQLPALFAHLSHVIVPVFCGTMYTVNAILWILSIVGCSGVMSITLLVMANQVEPLNSLDAVPYITFWMTIIFFALVFLNSLRSAITILYKACTGHYNPSYLQEKDSMLPVTTHISYLKPVTKAYKTFTSSDNPGYLRNEDSMLPVTTHISYLKPVTKAYKTFTSSDYPSYLQENQMLAPVTSPTSCLKPVTKPTYDIAKS